MATASAVSAAAVRLDYLLLDDGAPVRCDGDLRDAVVHLRSKIGRIEQLLSEADAKEYISEAVMKRVTQLACDIEDLLDSCAARQGKSGVLRCLLKSSCTSARRLMEDLQTFGTRIDEIKVMCDQRDSTPQVPRGHGQQDLAETSHIHGELNMDMEDDIERLRSVLVGEPSKLSLLAICGMGGMGKTTLARSLYRDPLVVSRFDTCAWVTVGMEFPARKILESILSSIMKKDNISEMETMELMERLYKAQWGKRYLVVLDDVWSIEVWSDLQVAFPNNNNGSRIMITTRNAEVAISAATHIHTMRMLSIEESWELFKMKFGVKEEGTELSPEMERIGKEIVKKCRGLPLAIATISSVLRRMNYEDWGEVLRKLQRSHNLVLGGDSLAQSYNDIPFHLKPCFLYVGHFPLYQAIPVEKLFLLWMAEGLIPMSGSHYKKRMEVADDYLKELVYRSLVVVAEKEDSSASEEFKSCQLHSEMYDVCIQKGKQEEFFEVIDFRNTNRTGYSTRGLAIYLNKFKDTDDLLLDILEAKHIIKSILFFDTDVSVPNSKWPKQVSDLKEFQRTRVLDFNNVDFQIKKLPRGIDRLTFLRYLSFGGCYLPEFPASLRNFPLLETLDLRVRVSCVMTIPNVLRKLTNLRHLYFPLAYQSDTNDKLKLDSLKKLQVLENFHASICDADDLPQLTNLEIFTGIVDGDNVDLKKTISYINGMKSLGPSSLVVREFDSYSEERRLIVATLLECNVIHSLDIEGYLGVFPRLDHGFGSNFTEMVFNGSEFSEDSDPMPILGKLPNLRSLALCNDAFIGKKMMCSGGDFYQLRSLKLATLQYLEELEVEKGAMPRLAIFTIERCDKLETLLADGLEEIATLEKLMIGSMPEEFQNQVNEMAKQMRKYGNDMVKFYDC